ncbi:hypothetical protein [Actinokineospora iranica]|uniref:Uncharacterized protein n=1 Tax=Actinokineospora iranica TaxID=1271860 RepID=A0A1G6QAI2_9PSEU|nr:hypothetical protein [Actinokineospora iranica]SDC89512.1 hypothetical protein SAMN05216174_105187 [Actinokineospora iranica]
MSPSEIPPPPGTTAYRWVLFGVVVVLAVLFVLVTGYVVADLGTTFSAAGIAGMASGLSVTRPRS